MPVRHVYCCSNATPGGQQKGALVQSEFWRLSLCGKVEQIEVDDKAVDADDLLISRVLEPCELQQLMRLCLQRLS